MTSLQQTGVPPLPGPAMEDQPGVLEAAIVLILELRGVLHDQLELAALEVQQAVHSLMTMIAAAVGIGVLLVTAWLGAIGAIVVMLIRFGVSPVLAMLLLVALNLVAVSILYWLIRRERYHLGFPATLRALKPVQAPDTAKDAI